METFDHLHTSEFEEPIVFRLTRESNEAFIPGHSIEKLLRGKYNLERQTEYDVAQSIKENHEEYAFDGAAVENVETVLQDIQELLENYNEIPDWIDDTDMTPKEWNEKQLIKFERVSS